MENLQSYIAGFNRMNPAHAAELIGMDVAETASHVLVNDIDLSYIEQYSYGTYWTIVERMECRNTLIGCAEFLYFNHYCYNQDDITVPELCDLLGEFAEWSRRDLSSADEMLHLALSVEPACRTEQQNADITWLNWFISTWESLAES